MNNNYKYFLSSTPFGTREVFPLGEGETEETYSAMEGFIADYRREINGNLILRDADFTWLYQTEISSYRCDPITITIQKRCTGTYSDWYVGRIKMNDVVWFPEKCICKIKITPLDGYTALEDQRETEVNLFDMVPVRKTLKLLYPDSELEYITDTTSAIPVPFQYWSGSGRPEDSGWVLWKHTFTGGTNTTYWVREKRTIDCALSLGTPWIYISETCPGAGKIYVRPAIVYGNGVADIIRDSGGTITDFTLVYKIFGRPEDGPTEFDNGMQVRDILLKFAENCSLTIASNFFQINPDEVSGINYVTGQQSKVLSLLAFQKSDVKRSASTENATIATVNFGKFFDAICLMYNLQFIISGTTLRLEHCSYFEDSAGLDLTQVKFAKYVRFKHGYSYDTTKLPNKEYFNFKEASPNTDFEGVPIIYETACATSGKDAIKRNVAEIITTDLFLCLNNPESDSQKVSDEGIFIAAADEIADEFYLISEAGILFGKAYPNNSVAWSQLLRDYHRHKRPFRSGKMNQLVTAFDSVIPTMKGEEISVPICCDDLFDPIGYVTTELGQGFVESSSFSLKTNMLKLNLMYRVQEPSIVNDPPFANSDSAAIYKNQIIDIDVLANDSDGQGIGTIDLVEITDGPDHGTAIVVNKKIRYTPDTDFVGFDQVGYRIRDNFGAYSNDAQAFISVSDPMPLATNKTFTVRKNAATVIPAPGVMVGDNPGAGSTIIVVSNTSPTGTHSVAITVNADGSFTYNAPNLVGTDTFNYTIRNDQSLEDTGTITMNIITVPASTTHSLAKSNYGSAQACSMYVAPTTRQNFYSTDASLVFGSILYKDDLLTQLADPGWYSNGANVYQITGTDGVIQSNSTC